MITISKSLGTKGKCFPESLDRATQREVVSSFIAACFGKRAPKYANIGYFLKDRNCCQTISDNFLSSGRNNTSFSIMIIPIVDIDFYVTTIN